LPLFVALARHTLRSVWVRTISEMLRPTGATAPVVQCGYASQPALAMWAVQGEFLSLPFTFRIVLRRVGLVIQMGKRSF
jgi:hypothetical protein